MGLLNYADQQVIRSRRKRIQVQNRDEVLSRSIKARGQGYFRPFERQTEIDVGHDVTVSDRDSTLPKTVAKSAVVYNDLFKVSGRVMRHAAEFDETL